MSETISVNFVENYTVTFDKGIKSANTMVANNALLIVIRG